MCQDGGGSVEEGNRKDETPDIGSSQQLARDVAALLFTSNMSRKSGAEKKFSDILSLYLQEMHSLQDEGELEKLIWNKNPYFLRTSD